MLAQMKVSMKTVAKKEHSMSSSFFPLVNALVYVDIDQGIHYGKKDELYKTLQSEVAGSFYTMVLMGTFICASIKFFL